MLHRELVAEIGAGGCTVFPQGATQGGSVEEASAQSLMGPGQQADAQPACHPK